MLELHQITYRVQDGDSIRDILRDVSLTVTDGEIACLTGPSGSGKSTALAVASRLVRPARGTVLLDGRDITALPERAAAAARLEHLGIVFQTPKLLGALTVREQLELMVRLGAGDLARLSTAQQNSRIDETLELVGISDLAKRRPAQLSGGQQQRANIARAIIHRPGTLLVDEPTSALDVTRSNHIMELLTSLTHDLGTATLVVTHEQAHLPLFDTVYRMQDGVLEAREGRTSVGAMS